MITKFLEPFVQSMTLEILSNKMSIEPGFGMHTFLPSKSIRWNYLLLPVPSETMALYLVLVDTTGAKFQVRLRMTQSFSTSFRFSR